MLFLPQPHHMQIIQIPPKVPTKIRTPTQTMLLVCHQIPPKPHSLPPYYLKPLNHQIQKKEEDGGEYMGLYIVSLARLSLAVVMNLASLEEDTHLNKIRFLANSKLYSLEKTIHKIQLETAATVSPQQPESALSEGDAEGFNLQNLNALETPQETVYNFLCFNELTENQKAELRLNQTEPKRTFALAINSAHDVFKEDSSVTKLVLRDHTGTVFCSRNFGKENYFHQPSYVDPKIDNSRFEYCEENARRILNLEHNITLI